MVSAKTRANSAFAPAGKGRRADGCLKRSRVPGRIPKGGSVEFMSTHRLNDRAAESLSPALNRVTAASERVRALIQVYAYAGLPGQRRAQRADGAMLLHRFGQIRCRPVRIASRIFCFTDFIALEMGSSRWFASPRHCSHVSVAIHAYAVATQATNQLLWQDSHLLEIE